MSAEQSAVGATRARNSSRLASFLAIPLAVFLIALVAVFFVIYDTSEVVGESMLPNLEPQDRLLVTKSYFDPRVGDVVIGEFVTQDRTSPFVKRIVAIAGDEVIYSGDDIWVNGVFADYPGVVSQGQSQDSETLVVSAGQVFIAGDNRPDSLDSRFVGTIPLEQIKGRAVAVFAPIDRIRRLTSGDTPDTEE